VNDSAETSFAFYNDVGNTHLATEGGQEDDELYGVDIMSDDDESSLLGLDEGYNMIKTIFDEQRFLRVLGILIGNSSSSSSLETGLLLLRRLGTIFVKKFE